MREMSLQSQHGSQLMPPRYVIVGQGTRLASTRSLHVVVAKAYTVGKALHLAVLLIAMLKNSQAARSFSDARVAMKLPEYGCELSCERNQLHKGR